MKKIDISRIPHKNVQVATCEIPHTNETVLITLLTLSRSIKISSMSADVILMERQPPGRSHKY
jgi:hypothetical protein